ncbi:DNA topoisomerase I [Candidatus Woesearchaeota archaeon]|nr:DNA topoisomerase I [Candidatus Woesearchaeota archaeon]
MVNLIITEKPAQSLKIAEALADTKPKKHQIGTVPYYEVIHKGKKILIGCAVGHLFTLTQKQKSSAYPIFDLIWKPIFEVKKASEFAKKYFETLKKLAEDTDSFIVACDYDIEGSLIGWNILRFIFNKKDAKRMKFSTLTKDELIESYEKASPHLDFPQIEAGETRHYMDWIWGINLSRALMSSIKKAGSFKLMSSGRVQGPALKIIVDRELEIKKFKPVPYWQIQLSAKIEDKELIALHKNDKFWDKKEASKILDKTKGKKAKVKEVKKTEYAQSPPPPFDLTTLQTEAYRHLGIAPKDTLALAQELYTQGLISYPRTSSQKMPASLGYEKILKNLSGQTQYHVLAEDLLKTNLKPSEGPKSDPAHPAIFPTGEKPKKLSDRQRKVYDLIVRRFLATFAPSAKRQTMTVTVEVNKEEFLTQGSITLFKGWHEFYGPYAKFKEEELPAVEKDQEIKNPKISMLEDETKPPKRYTPASIIKELEKKHLGTKATRSQILDSLYQRYYVKEKNIEATQLGIRTVETLEKFCPEVLDEELTRQVEDDMDSIMDQKKKKAEILEEAKKHLTKILDKFKKNELSIGKELLEATRETQAELSVVTPCTLCKEGNMVIRKGKFGNFLACSAYPKCKHTISLTQGLIKPTKEFCKFCNYPLVQVIRAGKRPFNYCINKQCPQRLAWIEKQKKKTETE